MDKEKVIQKLEYEYEKLEEELGTEYHMFVRGARFAFRLAINYIKEGEDN